MTSKEALKELFELAVFDDNCDLEKCKVCSPELQKHCGCYNYFQEIAKDLAAFNVISRLLKPNCKILDYEGSEYLTIKLGNLNLNLSISKEECKLLKEWLEND